MNLKGEAMTFDRSLENVPEYRGNGLAGLAGADAGEQHDARGLVMAILLCMGCWAALGFVLLT